MVWGQGQALPRRSMVRDSAGGRSCALLAASWLTSAPGRPSGLQTRRGQSGPPAVARGQWPLLALAALQRLRGSEDVSGELKELLAEQAAIQGEAPKAPWELLRSRAWRWQLLSILVLSSAMQLCGNDSVSSTEGRAGSGWHGGLPSPQSQARDSLP